MSSEEKRVFPLIPVKLSRPFEIARFCHRIVPLWRRDYLKTFLRACRICRQRRFLPYEAFRLGLFQPSVADEHLDNYTSRKIATRLQKAVNPESWAPLLKDKSILYRYLEARNLPAPKLYAVFFRSVPGWSSDGSILAGRDDWQRFFETKTPSEFVIKPCCGAFGGGVNIYKKVAAGFKGTLGNIYQAADIYDLMQSSPHFDAFVVQERLRNHPDILRLSPSEFLQTVRVTTFIDRMGHCQIIFAFFKLIGNQNITDNFGDGRNGNMLSAVRLERGTLEAAVVTAPNGRGAIFHEKHPQTGIEFETFNIPLWPDIIALAKNAAQHFLPLRTIGWDIAVTSEGPRIVEGNIWWNPLNRSQWKDTIEKELPYNL